MRTIRGVATAGVVIMVATIGWALAVGDFSAEGSELLGLPWGVTSIVDVYVGVALVLAWIRWRDGASAALVWLPVLVVLGHLGSAGYVAWRAWTTPDVATLLLGPRRTLAATATPRSPRQPG